MLTTGDHLIYTLPVVGVLTFIARPFLNRSEIFKHTLITTMMVIYITSFNNYVISNGAWTNIPEKVHSITGNVSIETYVFLAIQAVLTSLWAMLAVRWSIPCLYFNQNKKSYQLIQWIPILLLGIATAIGFKMIIPGQDDFYLGCLLCWTCPAIMFLWYGTGNFFFNKIIPSSIAIIVPTFYLCWVNKKTASVNLWPINKTTSLNVSLAKDVTFEETFYFFITNVIVVLAVLSYDKARGMMETYTFEFPERFGMNRKFISQLFCAFITPEYSMPSIVVDDIRVTMKYMYGVSKIVRHSSNAYSSGVRLDLMITSAFGRITDDIIDDGSLSVKDKKPKLDIFKEFIAEVFVDRKSDYEIKTKPEIPDINWSKYESQLTEEFISCFRAFSRIAFYQPRKPYEEQLYGLECDMTHKVVENEKDLMDYCDLVAGSFGPMTLYIFMYRSDNDMSDIDKKHTNIMEKSRLIAQTLQLVNISRDIIYDSETVGRTYLPTTFLENAEEEFKILCDKKDARSLGEMKIRSYASRILKKCYEYQKAHMDALNWLPHDIRDATRVCYYIYEGHVAAVQSSPVYPLKATVSTWNKILIAIYCLYIKTSYI